MFIRITGPDEFIFVVTYNSISGFHSYFQGWSSVTQHHSPDPSKIFLNWDGFQYRETFSAPAPPESIGAFWVLVLLVCYQESIPLNCMFLRAAHQEDLPELLQHWRKFFVLVVKLSPANFWFYLQHFLPCDIPVHISRRHSQVVAAERRT